MTTWILLRAAGIGAYLMLFLSVAWGLVATTSVMGRKVSKASAVALHQVLSTVAMVLLSFHLAGVLMDRFVPFSPLDVVLPLHGAFRPVAVAFGVCSMYLALVVLVSSWLRKRVGTSWWRRLHVLAAPAFTMAMVHGIFTGTDTVRPWMWWMYVSTGGATLFLLVVRALTVGLRPERRTHPTHSGSPGKETPTGVPARRSPAAKSVPQFAELSQV